MPPYVLKEVGAADKLDALVDVIWTAQDRPYMPSKAINFPVFDTVERAKVDAKQRLWRDHLSGSPECKWIYIEDAATGDVVAGTHYEWHDGSGFSDGIPHFRADWWPPGEARKFCENIYEQTMVPRALWMRRPNGGVCHMVVDPKHRNRGLGSMMMEWVNQRLDDEGIENRGLGSMMMEWVNQRLDDEGIEGFVEASELGRALYQKWGYRVVMKLDFHIPTDVPDEWQKLEHDLKMPPWYAMWRPPYGVVQPGHRTRPWQGVEPLQLPLPKIRERDAF